ncbi:lysine N(6)-hydroxylase/L-ornithine N(5)-oxygenase family protein [Mucilaginibacter sp. RCC_168]|uniref:lysine N(6)-hydroxylase/L-ornithine N(5)-oxygenase family protein n=1 Tax=Mucilaginibacter sp. RCC_168 TaxID=3239221 RepID=UPI003523F925
MKTKKVYNLIGIGIGPFNLGLAALTEPIDEFSTLFLDRSPAFDWHPGLMLSNATLQVPFMADLVTMADPTSRYSFLNFLKETNRLYKFFIRENFFILRKEYNVYCKWVAAQLSSCLFSRSVEAVEYIETAKHYKIKVTNSLTNQPEVYYAEKIVLGTGTEPRYPDFMKSIQSPNILHTSNYLYKKTDILQGKSVAVIGSGQSAAEVFQDLLPHTETGLQLSWFSRPDRFFPMEYAKLTLELTSPEYVDYFHNMPAEKRKALLAKQPPLYKGINFELINQIFDTLYEMSVDDTTLNVQLRPNSQLDGIKVNQDGSNELQFTQVQQQQAFTHQADYAILATGYKYNTPAFINGIQQRIGVNEDGLFDVKRNYSIDINGDEIFVQNAELHTHGFVTPDLGMGAYRNSCIINQVTGREIYKVEQRIAFQQFSV